MPLTCHSDAIRKPDAMLTKLMHQVIVGFLSCVPVLPGTDMALLPSSALCLGWVKQAFQGIEHY